MFETYLPDVPQRALTGPLPGAPQVGELLREAHARYAPVGDGEVADYIPALAEADPRLFERVFRSESASNHRDQGISDLLTSYGLLRGRPEEIPAPESEDLRA